MLNRREFHRYGAALGLSLPAFGALSNAWAQAGGAPSNAPSRTVKLPSGTLVSALGQGSARLGQGRRPPAEEQEALRTGISLGMTLIDTAELYGDGSAEKLIGRVIAGQRDRVFVVSK
ncbi:MAG: aldo/keto reductase, partial [Pseudolabrys sp.]|nr:aldo/keto reductase [Pseudolabrys sp.]